MTLAEIQAWLEEHKADQDVLSYLAGLSKVTPEGAKAYLETDEGKKLIKPIVDKAVTQGIETWKANNLDRLVEELHDKKFPAEDERDKRLREIEAKLEASERNAKRKELIAYAIKTATEKGLPVGVIERFVGDDETATAANIDEFEQIYRDSVTAEVEKRFKAGGGKPPAGGDPKPKDEPNPWKRESFNLTRQGQIMREDPERAKRLMDEAKVSK